MLRLSEKIILEMEMEIGFSKCSEYKKVTYKPNLFINVYLAK